MMLLSDAIDPFAMRPPYTWLTIYKHASVMGSGSQRCGVGYDLKVIYNI